MSWVTLEALMDAILAGWRLCFMFICIGTILIGIHTLMKGN